MKKIPSPLINEIKLAKIKRLPLSGLWEAAIVTATDLVGTKDCPKEDKNKAVLVVIKSAGRFMLHTKAFPDFPVQADEAMENLLDSMLEYGSCPTYINVMDSETESFLHELCGKLGISLTMVKNQDLIPSAAFEIFRAMGIDIPEDDFDEDDMELTDEEVADCTELLESLSDHQMIGLPYEYRLSVFLELGSEKFPADFAQRCWRILEPTFDEVDEEDLEKVYRIRFTLDSDQYFEIDLSGAENLLTLSTAVRFPFYMDSLEAEDVVTLSDGTSYHLIQDQDAMKPIERLNLKKGSTFAYDVKGELEQMNGTMKEVTYHLDCKVLRAAKTEEPPVVPDFATYVGFDRDPDKDNDPVL